MGEIERQAQVMEQMEKLEACIGGLVDSVDNLEGRLNMVLLTSLPTEVAKEKESKELVELANIIHSYKQKVLILSNRVQDIMDRLEL